MVLHQKGRRFEGRFRASARACSPSCLSDPSRFRGGSPGVLNSCIRWQLMLMESLERKEQFSERRSQEPSMCLTQIHTRGCSAPQMLIRGLEAHLPISYQGSTHIQKRGL